MATILAFAGLLAFLVISFIGIAILLQVLAEVAVEFAEDAAAAVRTLISRNDTEHRDLDR